MIIYLVTSGEYSDYRIIGAFSTKELAQKHIDKAGDGEIEEFKLDIFKPDDRYTYAIYVYDNEPAYVTWVRGNEWEKEINNVSYHSFTYGNPHYFVAVKADDTKHAVKIAGDLVAQFKALKE